MQILVWRDISVGAVIYNPAGMAYINTNKVSVSGSAFSQKLIDVELSGDPKNRVFSNDPLSSDVYHRGKLI